MRISKTTLTITLAAALAVVSGAAAQAQPRRNGELPEGLNALRQASPIVASFWDAGRPEEPRYHPNDRPPQPPRPEPPRPVPPKPQPHPGYRP